MNLIRIWQTIVLEREKKNYNKFSTHEQNIDQRSVFFVCWIRKEIHMILPKIIISTNFAIFDSIMEPLNP